MDGVFINLTSIDVVLRLEDNKQIIIPANPDLVTPIKDVILVNNVINAIVSTPLKEEDVKYLQGTKWINTVYNKITRSEEEVAISVNLVSSYVKYSFTKEQIDKINHISNRRTRLLILTEQDAIFWSSGYFECPFRNYRLFSYDPVNNKLIEYAVPKTYLDSVISTLKNFSDRLS